MLSRLLALLLVLFSGNMQANEFPVEIIEFIDNARVVAFINENDIDETSYWLPSAGSPELSIEDALNAVQQHIAADPDITAAELDELKLKQIPHHQRHWNYLVKMKITNHGKPHASYFVVLMNGKVIPAVREPGAVK